MGKEYHFFLLFLVHLSSSSVYHRGNLLVPPPPPFPPPSNQFPRPHNIYYIFELIIFFWMAFVCGAR